MDNVVVFIVVFMLLFLVGLWSFSDLYSMRENYIYYKSFNPFKARYLLYRNCFTIALKAAICVISTSAFILWSVWPQIRDLWLY